MNIFTRQQKLKLGAIAGGSLLLPIKLQQRSYAGDASSSISCRLVILSGDRQPPLKCESIFLTKLNASHKTWH